MNKGRHKNEKSGRKKEERKESKKANRICASGKRHSTVWLYFTFVVFTTVLVVFICITLIWALLFRLHVIDADPYGRKIPLVFLFVGSVLIGSSVAIYVGKVMIQPIQKIGDAFHAVSEGNFVVRVSEDGQIPEINEIARQFNAMTHDLSHIETLRTDFVANVSHEIKTPISSIEGYATLLQNPTLSQEKREYYVSKILENTRRLSVLSGNMLMLSKLENQEMVLDNKEFRLDEQLRTTILSMEDRWAEKQIDFDMDLPLQMYYGSEQLLEQVWSNLIGNAIKYSDKGGVIRIRMEQGQDGLTVVIADRGEGMTEEVIKHAFEKFYQGDSSRKAEGNGLGLALVKRILDICHGRVSVESEPGVGTAFTVWLPIAK